MKQAVVLNINGQDYEVLIESNWSLLKVIRDVVGFTGTKKGCDQGECGACTVLMDDKPVLSCIILAVDAQGTRIVTIEGLGEEGKPDTIQTAFVDAGAIQCGFCTPGMVLATKALLKRNPNPTEEEIRDGLAGNLCRCTGYHKIVEAVKTAAGSLTK